MSNPNTAHADLMTVSSAASQPLISASATLGVYQRDVEVDSTDGAVAITLPFPHECAGQTFTVYVRTYVSDVTIVTQDATPVTVATLTAADQNCTVYSTGKRWLEVPTVTPS